METMKEFTLYEPSTGTYFYNAIVDCIKKAKDNNNDVFLAFNDSILRIEPTDDENSALNKLKEQDKKNELYNEYLNGTLFSTEKLARKIAALINNE